MIRRGLAVAMWVATVGAGRLVAQSPTERVALQRLTDSLSFVVDTAALLGYEQSVIDRARQDRDNPLLHLRLGIVALRLAELRPDGPHREDAVGEFTWASELAPEWPWPWYGIGMAEARAPDRAGGFAGGLYVWFGLDRDQRAGQAFARALQADPTFVAGLLDYARIALTQRIDAPIESAVTALRVATATPSGWNADLLMARARLERRIGAADSAARLFRRAERLGADDATAWLELARTLPLLTDDDSTRLGTITRAYLLGARSDRDAVVADYRRNLEPIADSSELAAFDALHGRDRAAWLADFWRRRDAIDLRAPGARLAEHLRRWQVAVTRFQLPPFRRRYRWGVERFRSGDDQFDDRGLVYLRHGEPTLRVVWPSSRPAFHASSLDRSYGSESWRYDWPDGQLTLHFVAREDQQDFRLIDGPAELDVAGDALAAHAHEFRDIARLLGTTEVSAGWIGEAVRSRALTAIAIATETDSWRREYRQRLDARVQWFAVGERDGQPLLQVVYAIDGDALRAAARRSPDGTVPVRLRASALTPDGAVLTTLDTLQRFGRLSATARYIAARAELPVRPGRVRMRLGLELNDSTGVVFPLDSIRALPRHTEQLQLSAMLVGRQHASLSWAVTPQDTTWFDAGSIYHPGDTVSVYAELHGASPGQPLLMTLQVERRRSGLAGIFGRWATTLSLQETLRAGPEAITPVHRAIALAGLEPGIYRLTLSLSDGDRRVMRERAIDVRR